MSEPKTKPVREPKAVIHYQGVDITAAIAPFTLSITYTDHAHGKSDEIRISLENADLRWLNGWYPAKGDKIACWIGYANDLRVPCGTFTIDAPEFSGPPDTLEIRGQAASPTKDLRTQRDRAYEKTTLKGIAEEIAGRHGLQLVGDLPGIPVERISQPGESDLQFLTRLADQYGFAFSARDNTLTFHSWAGLEGGQPVLTLARTELASYRFTDSAEGTVQAAAVTYADPVSGRPIEAREDVFQAVSLAGGTSNTSSGSTQQNDQIFQAVSLAPPPAPPSAPSGDTARPRRRAENHAQAKAQAKAAVHKANKNEINGNIRLEGEPRLCAGVTIALTGFGRLSGRWLVERSTHWITRGEGYTTDCEIRRLKET